MRNVRVMRAPINPDTATPVEVDTELYDLLMEDVRDEAIIERFRTADPARVVVADIRRFELAAREARQRMTDREPVIGVLEARYDRDQWQRWYWVPKGHLHKDYNCTTLYRSTERIWDPKLADQPMEAAVERYGWHVCTVCVPAAPSLPAFRTTGTLMQAEADAAGTCTNQSPDETHWSRYDGYYANCETCGAKGVAVTSTGKLRKHKHEINRIAAERATRLADPKLMCDAEGNGYRVQIGGHAETYRTVQAVRNEYVRIGENAGGCDLQAARPECDAERRAHLVTLAGEYRANMRRLAEALAVKTGQTVDQVEAELAPKVIKKLKAWT